MNNTRQTSEWVRNCPACGTEMFYAKEKYQKVCEKRKSCCKQCQNREISRQRKGISLADRLGKKKAIEMRKKQSTALRGKPKPPHWIVSIMGTNNPNFGNAWSSEQKKVARVRMSKMLKIRGWTNRNYNPVACEYLDTVSKSMGWKLKHAKNGGEVMIEGYFVDGCDETNKIVVEYDEPHHYYANGELKKKDVDRMREIIQHTGYKFHRYNTLTKELREYN